MDKQNKENNKRRIWPYIAAIILAVIVIILLLLRGCQQDVPVAADPNGIEYDDSATIGSIEGLSKEEIQELLNKKVEDSMINISINASPEFASGTSEGNILIENSTVNNYPQIVKIQLDDTEEVIYESKAIPVGSKIENVKLSKELKKGEYEATAYFTAINPENGKAIGTAGAKLRITIKS